MNKEKGAEKGELSRERKEGSKKERGTLNISKWSFGASTESNAERLQKADKVVGKERQIL